MFKNSRYFGHLRRLPVEGVIRHFFVSDSEHVGITLLSGKEICYFSSYVIGWS